MKHSAVRVQEVNPAKLTHLYKKEFELSKVKAGETIAEKFPPFGEQVRSV